MVSSPMSNRYGIEPNEKLLKSIVHKARVPNITKYIGSKAEPQHNNEGFCTLLPSFFSFFYFFGKTKDIIPNIQAYRVLEGL